MNHSLIWGDVDLEEKSHKELIVRGFRIKDREMRIGDKFEMISNLARHVLERLDRIEHEIQKIKIRRKQGKQIRFSLSSLVSDTELIKL